MPKLKNVINQKVSSTGTGDITLGSLIPGFVSFAQAFAMSDEVFYSVRDGNNREVGLGTFDSGAGTITRDTVFMTLTDGTYEEYPLVPLVLTTNAVVSSSPSAESMVFHSPVWKRIFSNVGAYNDTYSPDGTIQYEVKAGSGIKVPGFPAAVDKAMPVNFNVPNDVSLVSELKIQVQTIADGTASGTVRFSLDLVVADIDGAVGATVNQVQDFVLSGTEGQCELKEFSTNISIKPGTVVIGKLVRVGTHANDNYGGTAMVGAVSALYLSESVGTPGKDAGSFFDWS